MSNYTQVFQDYVLLTEMSYILPITSYDLVTVLIAGKETEA